MNADGEVKKLKDLVKKLERQNQHLRYKTGKLGPHRNSSNADELLISDGSDESYKSTVSQQSFSTPNDSTDESFLKSINAASDTSWLFTLDKRANVDDPHVLEAWLRQDLEHPPTKTLALARRNILNCLDPPKCSDQPKSRNVQAPIESLQLENHPTHPEAIDTRHNHYSRKDEFEEDVLPASHHIRHMPLPSHTTASVHGLIPSEPGAERLHRSQSPSRAGRQHMPLPSRAAPNHGWSSSNTSDTNYTPNHGSFSSERHYRNRSPSPGQGSHRSPSPGQRSHRSPSPGQRRHRSPSPSYPIPSQSTAAPMRSLARGSPPLRTEGGALRDKSPSARRIPGSSTLLSGRSTTTLRKEGALTPRLNLTDKASGERSLRNPSGFYSSGSPRSHSGIPSRNPGLGSNKGSGGRQLKYLRTPELRGALSSEELYPGPSADRDNDRSRAMTPRRALPRPSRTTKSQFLNASNELSKYGRADSVRSLELQRPESVRSDETASETSDVWKDGEFF